MNEPKRAPRWTVAFLRALERTGEARAAALEAGIDHSTAYARRRAHQDFAVAWKEALRAHSAAKARAEEEEIAGIRKVTPPPAPPHHGEGSSGEELVVSGGQVRRAGPGRWSARKEKIFFEELAATANINRSAAAAGVSYNAVLARRLRHPVFAAKWDAVLETGKAAINMHLIEVAKDAFDPAKLIGGNVQPKVSVAEAIRIVQTGAAKKQTPLARNPFEGQASATGEELEEMRERLVRKFIRLKQRLEAEKLAQGWVRDERHDLMIPPGWVKSGTPRSPA